MCCQVKTGISIFAVIGKLSWSFRHSQMQLLCALYFSYSSAQTAVLCMHICPFQSAGFFPLLWHCKLYVWSQNYVSVALLQRYILQVTEIAAFLFFRSSHRKSFVIHKTHQILFQEAVWSLQSFWELPGTELIFRSFLLTEVCAATAIWLYYFKTNCRWISQVQLPTFYIPA